jgi:uncharacterized protein
MPGLAMVTGASSGIGEAYAERLASDGWDLLVVARRADRLDELAVRLHSSHGVEVRAIRADLSCADDVERICQAIASAPLDMLVNNAALAHYMPFAEIPRDQIRELVDLNVLAPVLLTRTAVDGMLARGAGTIINVASVLAFSWTSQAPFLPERVAYAATKSFVLAFSQLLSGEVSAKGIRVQVVCPGVVRTEFHTRQGIDMSAVPRMEPEQVVEASLADLADGVLVSIPGLANLEPLDVVHRANDAIVGVAQTAKLPERYERRAV